MIMAPVIGWQVRRKAVMCYQGGVARPARSLPALAQDFSPEFIYLIGRRHMCSNEHDDCDDNVLFHRHDNSQFYSKFLLFSLIFVISPPWTIPNFL